MARKRPAPTNVYSLFTWRACGRDMYGRPNGETPRPMDRFELSIHERKAARLRGGPPPNPRIIAIIPLAGGDSDG